MRLKLQNRKGLIASYISWSSYSADIGIMYPYAEVCCDPWRNLESFLALHISQSLDATSSNASFCFCQM